MGWPKLVLPWRGRPLIAHVLGALVESGVAPRIVVTGPATPALGAFARDGEIVFYHEAAAGMGTSLAAGVRALAGRVDAALVCLGDEPGIRPAVVGQLARLAKCGSPVRPRYRGHPGHPVLFPAALFAELGMLSGDRGARDVLRRHPPRTLDVDVPPPLDVDRPEDYRLLCGLEDATASPAGQRCGGATP